MTPSRDLGSQPLQTLLIRLKLTNHDLVQVSTKQLSYKTVAKGCKGRKLTLHSQNKILAALHTLRPEEKISLKDIFNY